MKGQVVIVGDGGHAKVVLDIVDSSSLFDIVGFTSKEKSHPSALLGYPYLGGDELLPELFKSGVHYAFVAIGDNERRSECTRLLREQGFTLINAISEHALVSRHALLGWGIAVMPGAIINVCTQVADGAIVNTNASVDHDCTIGEFAHIGPGTVVAGSAHIGAGALLGAGCRVLPGKRVGDLTIVGAGAVVVSDLPAGIVAVGVPATIKKVR